MAKKERFEAVQSLRFICFLMVFIVHCSANTDPLTGVWSLEIFFMLSGFMMVYSYADRELPRTPWGLVKFGYQRIGKLYPLHVETTLIQLVLCLYGYVNCLHLYGYDQTTWLSYLQGKELLPLIAHLTLLQDWVPNFTDYIFNLNGPSWFLSAMVFSYAMFPLIMRLLKKLKTTGNVVAVCIGIAIFNAVLTIIAGTPVGFSGDDDVFRWLTQHCPAIRCLDFFMGCAMGWLFLEYRRKQDLLPDSEKKPVSVKKWTVIEAFVLLLIPLQECYWWFLGSDSFCCMLKWCRSIIPVLLSGPVIMIFVLNRGKITKALNCKPLHYLGDISMYLYLIHYLFTNAWYMKEMAEDWQNPLTTGQYWLLSLGELILSILCSMAYNRFQKYKAQRRKAKLAAKSA